ncbi:MAG: hypothetical protein IK011_00185 [Bacteroidaceae bacterium]|nr:hypothetical protein [Bacteroidaceae bacterium]MBR4778292.1 hypothetical protein [Bacteroidaceae bacterium]
MKGEAGKTCLSAGTGQENAPVIRLRYGFIPVGCDFIPVGCEINPKGYENLPKGCGICCGKNSINFLRR